MEKYIPWKWEAKKAGVAILTSDKIDLKINNTSRDKEGHYVTERVTDRKARGSPDRGNSLQVSDIFYLPLKQQEEINYTCQIFFFPSPYKIKRRFLYGNVFLKLLLMKLYLLWNLPFFKMSPPKTNIFFFSFLKPCADNSSTKQCSYQLFHGWRMTRLLPSYLKIAYCGRGSWWNSVSLEVSVLSD